MNLTDNQRRVGPWRLARHASLNQSWRDGAGATARFVSGIRDRVLSTIEPLSIEQARNINDETWERLIDPLIPATDEHRAQVVYELHAWQAMDDDELSAGTWREVSAELLMAAGLAIVDAVLDYITDGAAV